MPALSPWYPVKTLFDDSFLLCLFQARCSSVHAKTFNPEDFNSSLEELRSTVSTDFNETCTFKNVRRGLKIQGEHHMSDHISSYCWLHNSP